MLYIIFVSIVVVVLFSLGDSVKPFSSQPTSFAFCFRFFSPSY